MTSSSSTVWREEERDGLRLMHGRLGGVEVAILPEVGGKMISLRAASGREWLWQTRRRPYRRPEYGGAFEAYDISGFDECFPGIGEGPYPLAPWQGVTVPDHGEVWTLPWETALEGNTLTLAVQGVRFPYRLEKRVTLEERDGEVVVRLDYRLENLSSFPLRYLWSAHPLLAASPGMQVLLPDDVRVRVDWSKGGRLGELGATHAWPRARTADGAEIVLDVLPVERAGTADKLYTDRLPADRPSGWCALYDPEASEHVALRFDPARVPYIGVWLNMGGWPLSGEPCFNVALEPCTGFPDRLDLAVQRDEAATLERKATEEWWLCLVPGRGKPRSQTGGW
jgi:hypothetical protein